MPKATLDQPPAAEAAPPVKDPKLEAFIGVIAALHALDSQADRYAVLSAAAQLHGFSLKLPQ